MEESHTSLHCYCHALQQFRKGVLQENLVRCAIQAESKATRDNHRRSGIDTEPQLRFFPDTGIPIDYMCTFYILKMPSRLKLPSSESKIMAGS